MPVLEPPPGGCSSRNGQAQQPSPEVVQPARRSSTGSSSGEVKQDLDDPPKTESPVPTEEACESSVPSARTTTTTLYQDPAAEHRSGRHFVTNGQHTFLRKKQSLGARSHLHSSSTFSHLHSSSTFSDSSDSVDSLKSSPYIPPALQPISEPQSATSDSIDLRSELVDGPTYDTCQFASRIATESRTAPTTAELAGGKKMWARAKIILVMSQMALKLVLSQ